MKILLVGGTFDNNGGKVSSVVDKFANEIYNCLLKTPESVSKLFSYNGGHFNEIEEILQEVVNADIVFWWANVPNDLPKIRNVKEINPKCMLVTSKRNDNNKYSFQELINRALGAKANLCLEFSKNDNIFNMMLFDPLGNCWYKGSDISECCMAMLNRLTFLKSITRQGCENIPEENVEIPEDTDFFNIVKGYADVFHKLINPAQNVTRFLGNSSFRCQRGFPSFKKDGIVYVSKRNVDKRYIDKSGFVPTKLFDNKIFYYGENKPSVDTPIQLRLYEQLPNINYMIHAHVYIKNAPFTQKMIPCGGLEEVEEVINTIKREFKTLENDFYVLNLIGHGCIVMSSNVEKLKELEYISRLLPEVL